MIHTRRGAGYLIKPGESAMTGRRGRGRSGSADARAARGALVAAPRLVVVRVALIAVVCAVIGTVTTLALHDYLYGQLDGKLRRHRRARVRAAAARGAGGPPTAPSTSGDVDDDRSASSTAAASPASTIGAVVANGRITAGRASARSRHRAAGRR